MDKKAKIATIATLVLVALLVIGLTMAAPKGKGKVKKQCNDGIDNDGDDLIDLADPGCDNKRDNDEYNAPETYCGDEVCNGDETCATCEADCGICDSCSDTDGGHNPWQKGIVSGYDTDQPYSYTEYCDGNVLTEYWCLGGGSWSSELYNCAIGGNSTSVCINGACV